MLKFLSGLSFAKRVQIMLLGAAIGLAFANLLGLFLQTGTATDTIGVFSGAAVSGFFAKKLVFLA